MTDGWKIAKGFLYIVVGCVLLGYVTTPIAGLAVGVIALGSLILSDALASQPK